MSTFINQFLFLTALAFVAVATTGHACDYTFVISDPEADTTEVALRTLPAVFVGRVISVEVAGPDSMISDLDTWDALLSHRATFAVHHAWTGSSDTVTVDWWSNCEVVFELGQDYVVFAEEEWNETTQEVALVAPIWWPTAPLERSHHRVEALNAVATRLRESGFETRLWNR